MSATPQATPDAAQPAAEASSRDPVDLSNLTAAIVPGSCSSLDGEPAYDLDVPAPGSGDEPVALRSVTSIDTTLNDLLAGAHAVVVMEGDISSGVPVVCGDLGGSAEGGQFTVGLAQAEGSGVAGIAWLRDDGQGGTEVNLFLGDGLFSNETSGGAEASPMPDSEPASATPAPA